MKKYTKPQLLEGEEIRPLVLYFKEHPQYSISNYGRYWSHMRRTGKGKGGGNGSVMVYDPDYWQERKWSKETQLKHYKNGQKYNKVVAPTIVTNNGILNCWWGTPLRLFFIA